MQSVTCEHLSAHAPWPPLDFIGERRKQRNPDQTLQEDLLQLALGRTVPKRRSVQANVSHCDQVIPIGSRPGCQENLVSCSRNPWLSMQRQVRRFNNSVRRIGSNFLTSHQIFDRRD